MAHWRAFNERESRPEHHYQLADFGFDAEGIAAQFSKYIAAYFLNPRERDEFLD